MVLGHTDETPDGGYSAGFLGGANNMKKVAAYAHRDQRDRPAEPAEHPGHRGCRGLRRRQLPPTHPLDMPVHPGPGKLERLCDSTGSGEGAGSVA